MDYYIKIDHEKVPVSEDVYKEWCRGERKERYFREGDISNGVFSYDALDTEEMNGSDLFTNPFQVSTEAAAEWEIMTEWLPTAIESLSAEEKRLLLRRRQAHVFRKRHQPHIPLLRKRMEPG